MYGKRRLTAIAILAAAVFTASPVAAQEAGRGFPDKVAGAYLAAITVAPTPLLGNAEAFVMPELVTLERSGTSTATPSLPGFPFPTTGGVVTTVWSDGVASWGKTKGRTLAVTYWRFLSDPTTGQLLGIAKIHSEVVYQGGLLIGDYTLELLNPDQTPAMLGGQPVVLGPSPVVLTPLEVEDGP